jgi:hypothetical protein
MIGLRLRYAVSHQRLLVGFAGVWRRCLALALTGACWRLCRGWSLLRGGYGCGRQRGESEYWEQSFHEMLLANA